jgi:outer membrane protein assembly factor BamB
MITWQNLYRVRFLVLVAVLLPVLTACTASTSPQINAELAQAAKRAAITSTRTPVKPSLPSNPLIVLSGFGLYALNRSDGSVLWQDQLSSITPPIVSNGKVYALETAVAAGLKPQIVALDQQTGTQLWSYTIGTNNASPFGQLTLINHTLIAAIANDGLLGLDADSGKLLWHQAISFTGMPAAMASTGDSIAVILPSGNLDVFTADGQLRWEKNIGASNVTAGQHTFYTTFNCGSISIIIVSGSNICLGAFDSTSGNLLWHASVSGVACVFLFFCGNAPSKPFVSGDTVYELFTNYTTKGSGQNAVQYQDQRIDAFDIATGSQRWQYVIPDSYGVVNSGTMSQFTLEGADNSYVYVESDAGNLTALSGTNHTPAWTYTDPNGQSSQFIEDSGQLYLVTNQAVTALSAQHGSQLWATLLNP